MIFKKAQVEIGLAVLALVVFLGIILVSTGLILNPFKEHTHILNFESKKDTIPSYEDIYLTFQITNPKRDSMTLLVNVSYNTTSWEAESFDYQENVGFLFEELYYRKIKEETILFKPRGNQVESGQEYNFILNVYDEKGKRLDRMVNNIKIK